MAVISTTIKIASGAAYTMTSADTTLVVEQTGAAVSLSGSGVYLAQEATPYLVDVTVDGLVLGSFNSFNFYDNGGYLTIGATGQIRGGSSYAIFVSHSAVNPDVTISNAGQVFGYQVISTGTGDDLVTNTGTIQGTVAALLKDGDDRLVNAGTIIGDVWLGSGDDRLVMKPGGTIDGTVDGGEGSDTIVIRDNSLTLTDTGTSGTDTIRSFVNHHLEDGFENLTLRGHAARRGIGNAADNTVTGNKADNVLKGLDGADHLNGRGGDDKLVGGSGDDFLVGAGGHDTFVFSTGSGHDTINGFAQDDNAEKIDLSHLGSVHNFHDLTAHHMSQHGSDVVIHAGGGDVLTLLNVQLTHLQAVDFIF